MEIKNRFTELAETIFGLDLNHYLSSRNRNLLGVEICPLENCFKEIFGDFPSEFIPTINKSFHDSIAGYRVDVGSHFQSMDIHADVLLLNTECLSMNTKDLDSLLIHELCHLIIDSDCMNETNIKITDKDTYHGSKLYKKTDQEYEHLTKHNLEFCTLLAAAGEAAGQEHDEFKDRWDLINSSMRYDLKGSARQ